jgi:hypothetical protein
MLRGGEEEEKGGREGLKGRLSVASSREVEGKEGREGLREGGEREKQREAGKEVEERGASREKSDPFVVPRRPRGSAGAPLCLSSQRSRRRELDSPASGLLLRGKERRKLFATTASALLQRCSCKE